MVGWHHRFNRHKLDQSPGEGEGQGGLACCDSWGRKESDMTERLNWTELKVYLQSLRRAQLYNPMDCSMPGFPILHHLLEFAQTHVHWVGNAIQPSRPLPSPSPPAFNLSQHQGLFKWVSSLHQVAKVLELQHQSFQFNIQGWFPLGLTGLISLLSKGLLTVFSNTTLQKHRSSVLRFLNGPTLISIHDYWKNHSFD